MVLANQDVEVLGGATNVRLDTKERQQEGRAQDHGAWAEVHWISHKSLDISTRRSLDFEGIRKPRRCFVRVGQAT